MDQPAADVSVDADVYLYFVRRAIDGMASIVDELGDDLACRRPDLPGANTPFGLLTHTLGVVEYWAGRLVAGREVARDRGAEFDARGPVSELLARAEAVLSRLADDVAASRSAEPPREAPEAWAQGPDRELTQGGILFHVFEEVAQHHGQLEVLRDALRNSDPAPADDPAAWRPSLQWLRAKRGVKWQRPGPDVLPAWVADMDFPVAPAIRTALVDTIDRGDLGYPVWPSGSTGPGHPLADAFAERMSRRHGWQPAPEHVRGVTDLIQAAQIVLTLATTPGQAVIAHTPNSPPFLATVRNMRRLVASPLIQGAGSWHWDPERLRADLRDADPAVLLLVNPQNPTGRVFTRAELEQLAELAEEHDLLVISDEIHAELGYGPAPHIPFASLSEQSASRTITVTSATKAFNIAGLRAGIAHIGPDRVRAAWDAQPPDQHGATNVLGVEATLAAWRHGDDWLSGTVAHLHDQRDHLAARLPELPGVTMTVPEAGYLAWLDCTDTGIEGDPADFFRRTARVELSPGPDFGPGSERHARLNFATSRNVLDAILDRMSAALRSTSAG
jgi:cystathionine beta-lyase